MTRFVKEFKEFINRGSVLDLAVGIVIGVAFTAVVNSFVDDILNAIIGAVVGKPNFDDLTLDIGSGVVRYGAFLTALINFAIIAFALFLVVKAINAFRRQEETEPESTEKDVLLEIRDLLARGLRGTSSRASARPATAPQPQPPPSPPPAPPEPGPPPPGSAPPGAPPPRRR